MGLLDSATYGEAFITLSLADPNGKPAAFGYVEIAIDYGKARPYGVLLPLEMLVTGPSPSSFVRKYFRRVAPSSLTFAPKEGGRFNVLLRETAHNRWWGNLVVDVAGDHVNASDL